MGLDVVLTGPPGLHIGGKGGRSESRALMLFLIAYRITRYEPFGPKLPGEDAQRGNQMDVRELLKVRGWGRVFDNSKLMRARVLFGSSGQRGDRRRKVADEGAGGTALSASRTLHACVGAGRCLVHGPWTSA